MRKNIGIIGCGGRIRGLLGRLPGLGQDIAVAAVCDVDERSIGETLATVAPGAKVYADYRQLAADPSLDWVFVGSWNCFHREHAVAALESGKHVFCEKPLATTLEDCLAIRDAWRASGRMFCLGFVLRYSPHYQKIRELVRGGELGRIVSLEFNETLGFEHGGYIHSDWRRHTRSAGPHILEKCCHDLDLVIWILGSLPLRAASFGGLNVFRPENAHYVQKLGPHPNGAPAFSGPGFGKHVPEVNPFLAEKDIVDNQVAIMEFANAARASFHTNACTNLMERRMYICGTEGTLRADVLTGVVEWGRIGHREEVRRVETGSKGGHGGADGILRKSLSDSILTGAAPLADPEDGLRSAIAALGIDRAMESGAVIDLAPMWELAGIVPGATTRLL